MPDPTAQDVYIDQPLSNIAIGWAQKQTNFIADRAFPRIPTDFQSGKYYQYDRSYWFTDEAQKRAPGTESQGGGWKMDDPGTYFCEEWAWHRDTPWEVMRNAKDPIKIDEVDAIFVTQKLLIRKERLFLSNFFKTGTWTNDFTGVSTGPSGSQFIFWDDYSNSDPLKDFVNFKDAVAKTTGFEPNALVISSQAFNYLKQHPDILDRYKYTQTGILTESLIAKVLELDYLFVAKGIVSLEAEGATATYDYILGNDALLYYYNDQNPSPFTPSAAYTFYWEAYGLPINFHRIDMRARRAERREGFFYEDYKLVSADLGCFISNCISASATS